MSALMNQIICDAYAGEDVRVALQRTREIAKILIDERVYLKFNAVKLRVHYDDTIVALRDQYYVEAERLYTEAKAK